MFLSAPRPMRFVLFVLSRAATAAEPRMNFLVVLIDDMGLRAVVREGDALLLGGVPRVVQTFDFLPENADAPGQTRSFAADGTLALRLVFTDGAQSIATFADGVWRDLATSGGPAPVAGGTWKNLRAPAVSADGWVAFVGEVTRPGAPPRIGVFRFAPDGAGAALALSGAVTPAGGVWSDFGSPVVAASGAVAFFTEHRAGHARGLWKSTAHGLDRLAVERATAPGSGAQTFRRFHALALSDDGRVLLAADLAARAPLAVVDTSRPITRLEFLPRVPLVGAQTRAFNAIGRLTFRAQFAGGGEAICRALD